MATIRQGLQKLEKNPETESTVLIFADKSAATIPGPGPCLLQLLCVACHRRTPSPDEARYLSWISKHSQYRTGSRQDS